MLSAFKIKEQLILWHNLSSLFLELVVLLGSAERQYYQTKNDHIFFKFVFLNVNFLSVP